MAVQSTLASILFNPLLTGPLLLYAKQNPSTIANLSWWPGQKIYQLPFEPGWPFPSSIRVGASKPMTVLRFLFTWGCILWANKLANRLALNYGHWRKQGKPWEFEREGAETILITGGCSGFGLHMVKMFSEQTKAKIIVLDVSELPAELKNIPRLTYHKCDLTSPTSIDETIKSILEESVPTVLINNAGIATSHTILDTTDEWLEKIFRVNLLSHFQLIRLILPKMMANKKGHIVSLASMASYTGCANIGDYCATKAGVLGLHESLVTELGVRYKGMGGHAIQASIVHPLWARTPLVGSWVSQMERKKTPMLEPEMVAKLVVKQVLSGRSGSVFVPEMWKVGSLLRGFPDWFLLKLRRDLAVATADPS